MSTGSRPRRRPNPRRPPISFSAPALAMARLPGQVHGRERRARPRYRSAPVHQHVAAILSACDERPVSGAAVKGKDVIHGISGVPSGRPDRAKQGEVGSRQLGCVEHGLPPLSSGSTGLIAAYCRSKIPSPATLRFALDHPAPAHAPAASNASRRAQAAPPNPHAQEPGPAGVPVAKDRGKSSGRAGKTEPLRQVQREPVLLPSRGRARDAISVRVRHRIAWSGAPDRLQATSAASSRSSACASSPGGQRLA